MTMGLERVPYASKVVQSGSSSGMSSYVCSQVNAVVRRVAAFSFHFVLAQGWRDNSIDCQLQRVDRSEVEVLDSLFSAAC